MGMAKIRKTEIQKLKAQPKPRKLLGAYWGYKPKNSDVSFEFTNHHLVLNGLTHDAAQQIVQNLYEGVQYQLKLLESMTPEELSDFADEQERLLIQVARELKPGSKMDPRAYVERVVIGVSAVSTLVATGRLEQDQFNGDQFAFA